MVIIYWWWPNILRYLRLNSPIYMKKIFYIITKSNWGGAQLYVYNLATNLKDSQFGVAVVAGGEGELFRRLEPFAIQTISLPSLGRDINLRGDLQTFRDLVALFKKEKPDIIHLNSSKIGILGALAGRASGVPKIIFTAHGWPFNESRGLLWRLAIKFASYLTALLSTTTIVIHKRDLAETRFWPFTKRKITLIHSGIGENFYYSKSEAREHLLALIGKPANFFDDKIILGNVAELHKNKGLSYAIEALCKLPANFIYIVLGEGEQRAHLQKIIEKNNLSGRVFLPGFIPSAPQLVKGFDIFLFPSVKEGLSFTLLEAGLAGLPVVATNVGGTVDIIESGVSGLLTPPRNPALLTEAVLKLHSNSQVAQEYGQFLKNSVLTKFDLERMLTETTHLYLEA